MANGYYASQHCFSSFTDAVNAHYTNEGVYTEVFTDGIYHYRPIIDSGIWKLQVRKPGGIYQTLEALPTNVVGTCSLDALAYDYTSAAAMFGFAFTTVFSLWYLTKNLGMIINAVRRW